MPFSLAGVFNFNYYFNGDCMNYHETQLNKHMHQLDEDTARDEAIELLAEQLIATATKTARDVVMASNHNLTMVEVAKLTDHSDEFNELYYDIAEKMIKISEGK